jgi:hypothetical protein
MVSFPCAAVVADALEHLLDAKPGSQLRNVGHRPHQFFSRFGVGLLSLDAEEIVARDTHRLADDLDDIRLHRVGNSRTTTFFTIRPMESRRFFAESGVTTGQRWTPIASIPPLHASVDRLSVGTRGR